MKSKLKTVFSLLLMVICVCALALTALSCTDTSGTSHSKDSVETTSKIESDNEIEYMDPVLIMGQSVGIRVIEENPGLAFYADIENYDIYAEYGFVLVENGAVDRVVAQDIIVKLEEMDIDHQKVECLPEKIDSYIHHMEVVFDIAIENNEINYLVVAYCFKDGKYSYSSLEDAVIVSLKDVASNFLNSGNLSDEKKEILKIFAGIPTTPQQPEQTVELAVLGVGFGKTPYLELAKAYMAKNPSVQVKIRFDYEINSNVENQVNNNVNVADIYSVRDRTQVLNFGLSGKAMDLSTLLDLPFGEGYAEANITVRENLDSKAVEACSLNGKTYCIPEYTSATGIVYNASLFEEYGWEIPTTTKELEDLCEQILKDTKGTVSPFVYFEESDGYLNFAVDNWLNQYAGIGNLDAFYKYDSAELFAPNSVISAGKKLAHENLIKFFSERSAGGYALDGSWFVNYRYAQKEVISGRCAMMLNGAWFESEMADELENPANEGLKIGMFPLPEMSDASGNVLHADGYTTQNAKRVLDASYGAYYFIPTQAKNREAAIDFLKFINSDEGCAIYTKYVNTVRPAKYNLDVESEEYANLSFFGKSVINMANENYLYTAFSTSPLAIDGVISLYPKGSYWCKLVLSDPTSNKPADKIMDDYNYVKNNWSYWVERYGLEV